MYQNAAVEKVMQQVAMPHVDVKDCLWVVDVTNIRVNNSQYSICVVIDASTRSIIAHQVSSSGACDSVMGAIRKAYEVSKPLTAVEIRTDRSACFQAKDFQAFLQAHNISQSYSRLGHSIDNAIAEAFFTSLKRTVTNRKPYHSDQDFCSDVQAYIDWYNSPRNEKLVSM